MKGWIGWFARNGVAANLVMIVVFVTGILAAGQVVIEVFPEISSQTITVTVPYLGAAPEEVEEGVCVRIEEEIQDLEGIEKLRSIATEGVGTVVVELETDADVRRVLDDVKARVDAIETFPEETEKPIVQEIVVRRKVITIALFGDVGEGTLKALAEQVRDRLNTQPAITQVDLASVRPYEISIEVSENTLRRYGLTFDEVVNAVRQGSVDLPGGSVKAEAGEILLRTKGQAYRGEEFERIVLRARPDGSRLLLGDVATVVDGFADTDQTARFDGQPTALVQVYRVGDQSALEIARQVKAFVAEIAPTLPAGVEITTWQDDTLVLRDRLRVLIENGRMGLVLVLLVLALFLQLRLALWVSVGIAVSFFGAVALMPGLDVSVNVISLFAFIMVLGIVVDDAIVVGENIYRHVEMGKRGLRAAIDGAQEVGLPVVFAVLTSVAAFWPLLNVEGASGEILRNIPLIVIACLAFSLVESLFVLPNHLSHLDPEKSARRAAQRTGIWARVAGAWERFQNRFSSGLAWVIEHLYRPSLERILEWRYAALAVALSILMITGGMIGAGLIKFEFFPNIEADNAVAMLTLPPGTPESVTSRAIARIEEAAFELERQLGEEGHDDVYRHILASVGEQPFAILQQSTGPNAGAATIVSSSSNIGEVNIELVPAENRTIGSREIARRWRELTGPIPDAVELTFSSTLVSFGAPIDIQLTATDLDRLRAAAEEIKKRMQQYPGVFDIADSFRAGKREIKLDITPEAEALGLGLSDLARQVRQGFYGAEAQRIQRGRDDIRVMVRYPEEERETLESLERMRVRTPDGGEVPFSVAGEVDFGRGFSTIQRTDRQRTVNVTADVDTTIANANEIVADLEATVLPEVLSEFPGVTYSLAGEQEEQRETIAALMRAFGIALIMIYALLAIPFRSYLQPLIVMSAIPFGLIGAVAGHLMLGMNLTMLSLFGVVALTGVVVNDSLVMVDFINRRNRSGVYVDEAIREAGTARFRPILLTSLTTFAGLTPLLLEKSLQAQFLIPMAASLAFGVLFATLITLVLVPVLYRVLEDIRPTDAEHESEDADMGSVLDESLPRVERELEPSATL